MKNILHIGMPKTGTTTLQYNVFPHIAEKTSIKYLGLLQPHKERKQHPAMSALHNWFMHGKDEKILISELERAQEYGPIFLSNETILSSNIHSSWCSRIERLSGIVEKFDMTIYLSIRDPVLAMHSYFCEQYLNAPSQHHATFFGELLHGDLLKIYKYAYSIPFIEETFRRNIVVESYEDIILKQKSQFLSSLVSDGHAFPTDIGEYNKKLRSNGKIIFEKSTFRDVLRRRVYSGRIGRSTLARKVVARMGFALDFLDLVKMPPVVIPALTEHEVETLRRDLQADIEYVASRYAIIFPKYLEIARFE